MRAPLMRSLTNIRRTKSDLHRVLRNLAAKCTQGAKRSNPRGVSKVPIITTLDLIGVSGISRRDVFQMRRSTPISAATR